VRDRGCPRRGDFAPPRLPRAAPVEALPPVEDALKAAAIPHTRRARPIQGEGRKDKGKEREAVSETVSAPIIQSTCSANEEVPRLLCFCCPMLQFAEYQELYVGKDFVSATAPQLDDGKDIIQLHSEFTIRKSKDEAFIRDAQKKFPESFHSDEDLANIINRAYLSIDRGSGHIGLDYRRVTPTKDHWLENMGPDPENDRIADILKDADTIMEGWSMVKSSASLSTTPPPLPPADVVEYSMMLGGKRVPLGFADQLLGPPASGAGADIPSETVHNV
jgi:hypothetical protein